MIDKEMLAFWKANEKPFGMATCEQRNWLLNFKGPVESYGTYEYQEWGRDKDDHIKLLGRTYRIPADYEPEKRGRWVEYPIVKMDDRDIGMVWAFLCEHANDSIKLSDAPGMVGFGGVRYGNDWKRFPGFYDDADGKPPLKPRAVRFWVEE